MPSAVSHRQEKIGPRYEIEIEAGPQDNAAENQNGKNFGGREQPVKWNDPDDAISEEDQPRAGLKSPSRIR
jgi:hypothetical protein